MPFHMLHMSICVVCVSVKALNHFKALSSPIQIQEIRLMDESIDVRIRTLAYLSHGCNAEGVFAPVDIKTALLSIVKCGWEDALQGLVQLSVTLIDSCGPRTGPGMSFAVC